MRPVALLVCRVTASPCAKTFSHLLGKNVLAVDARLSCVWKGGREETGGRPHPGACLRPFLSICCALPLACGPLQHSWLCAVYAVLFVPHPGLISMVGDIVCLAACSAYHELRIEQVANQPCLVWSVVLVGGSGLRLSVTDSMCVCKCTMCLVCSP